MQNSPVEIAREKLQKLSDTELTDMVNDIAKTIVVRTYNEYGSSDDRRDSEQNEYVVIRCVAYSAIYTFTHDVKSDVQTIVDMAEITLMKLTEAFPQFSVWGVQHCNCYDTIYKPLMKLFGVWG